MVKRPCKACQKRRKLLEAKLLAKQAKGKKVQAAAIGAVLTTTALVGRLIGEEGGKEGCRRPLERGQYWAFCGETDMGQTLPALCTECGGEYQLKGIGEEGENEHSLSGIRDNGITEPSSTGSREDRGQPGG